MRIVVSGTKFPTQKQIDDLTTWISSLPTDTVIIQGCCIGIDTYAAFLAKARGLRVEGYVPFDRSRVDPDVVSVCDLIIECPNSKESYRTRNEMMVFSLNDKDLDHVRAYPGEEKIRSGTMMTVNIAKRAGFRAEII